ncbi:MAG: 4Fe-4S dicluster domain-containing protein [Planctomycetota bacterium]
MHLNVDAKKCTGCRVCLTVCSLYHFKEVNPKKAALMIEAKFPKPGTFEPFVCNQCGTCASVCPAEAISEKNVPMPSDTGRSVSEHRSGVYIIDAEKCTGCGVCVEECPTKVMFLHDDSPVPIKCDLCKECIAVCGTKVLSVKEA